MRKVLGGLVALLLLIPLPSLAEEKPCAEGMIHVLPYCFTPVQLTVYLASQVQTEAPRAVSVAGVEQWRSMVAYYWPSQHVDRMLRIMRCESGGDPEAWNRRTDDRGLFQINQKTWATAWPGDHFDPWTNAAVAYQIWLEADRHGDPFRPWVCKG